MSNLYKIEIDNTISCLQEKCTYKNRNPNIKHESILRHYRRCHKDIYKPYSRSLNKIKFKEKKYEEMENLSFLGVEEFKQAIIRANDDLIQELQKCIFTSIQVYKEKLKK
ncbi:3230_t:CDS:1 [Scutellospora calospora]|uniref:3230_t:CDS:1 n=1 Tax=Scutellospora calospora TaxID=85575 RepID=A0ACA9L4M6_9GLOM|nr:3230_t:CDS:1 [Scutellospora calospora]